MKELKELRIGSGVYRFRRGEDRVPPSPRHPPRNPLARTLAQFRHTLLQAVFGDLGRVVDAGCGTGLTVAEFRRLGTDCLGFDECCSLDGQVPVEMRPHLRTGGFDAMPYSRADRIKTMIAFDSIGNTSIDCLAQLPDELRRLGVRQFALSVVPDPLAERRPTLQSRAFYQQLLAQAGLRLMHDWTPMLARVRVPTAWNEVTQRVEWTELRRTGYPANAWNSVPGYLFFEAIRAESRVL